MHVAMEITHSSKLHNGETGSQISPNGSGYSSPWHNAYPRVNWSSVECRGVTTDRVTPLIGDIYSINWV